MPPVRVYLHYLDGTLNLLLDDVAQLQGKGADRATERKLAALRRKLETAKRAITSACPEVMFQNFDIVEPAVAARAKRKAARSKKRKAR